MDESNKSDPMASGLPAVKTTLAEYRKIVNYPAWNFYSQAFIRTRSYEQGLEGAMRLIELTREFRDQLSNREYNSNMASLWFFVLNMLDRLDRWEEYLAMWDRLRADTAFTWSGSTATLRRICGSELDPWVICENDKQVQVHFLWGTLRRKGIIEKKLLKSREGGKIRNMVHRKREELSEEEIQERFDRVVQQFEYAKRLHDLVRGIATSR
ncbi:MAG: hypothetical protein NT025_04300 [bacterium]|nr:hypothetical protein [bacterium]